MQTDGQGQPPSTPHAPPPTHIPMKASKTLVFPLFDSCVTDGRTDRQTDGPPSVQTTASSTLDFLLVHTQDRLPELVSNFKEIFLVAPFEKNPKLIIFHPILHTDFT